MLEKYHWGVLRCLIGKEMEQSEYIPISGIHLEAFSLEAIILSQFFKSQLPVVIWIWLITFELLHGFSLRNLVI